MGRALRLIWDHIEPPGGLIINSYLLLASAVACKCYTFLKRKALYRSILHC